MISFNGRILKKKPDFTYPNRAFSYGDGFFETIRKFDNQFPFISLHFDRLQATAKVLQMELPKEFTKTFLVHHLNELTLAVSNARIRITFFRKAGGLYTPTNNQAEFLIEFNALESQYFPLNLKGFKANIYPEKLLQYSPLSSYKTCNALPYVLAGLYKKSKGLDATILLNDKEELVEGNAYNLFFIKNGICYTPSLKTGCINGIFRSFLFKFFKAKKINIVETEFSVNDLDSIEEIWLTNSIQGIQWINNLDGQPFHGEQAIRWQKQINRWLKEKNDLTFD